jgi:ubiquinone/menaquinone biosynthesis C-methylase UbiE
MCVNSTKKKWEDLHQLTQFQLKYPSENVIHFVKANFQAAECTHLLDLGCGAGRHLNFIAKEGYKVTGLDFSQSGLDAARALLEQSSIHADLVQGSVTELPFADESFDGIVCFGVLYYLMPDDIRIAVKEMHRVLKPGAKAFVVVRSCRDRRFGIGEQVADKTYRLSSNFSNEQGMVMNFMDPDDISSVFGEFEEVKIGITEESFASLEELNSDYLITATKGGTEKEKSLL